MLRRDWPRPADVWRHYQRSVDSLTVLRSVPPEQIQVPGTWLCGLLPAELERAFVELREELDLEVSMALVASYEAVLRLDYLRRQSPEHKDEASLVMRVLFKHSGAKVKLEVLLDRWKVVRGQPDLIGEFKKVLKYRHWLAHGRYFVQKSGLGKPSPEDLYERGEAVMELLQPLEP